MPNPKPKPPLLPNLKLMLMPLTTEDTVTDTPDTVDTVMAVMVTTVELLLRIKSLDKFCLNNLAPTYPFLNSPQVKNVQNYLNLFFYFDVYYRKTAINKK